MAPLSKQKMSLATAGIYCTTSLPLSRAMEDSSIIVQVQQLQILYRGRYSMYPRHNACSAIVERSRRSQTSATRRRSLGIGTMAKCQTATDERASQPTLWRTGSQCSWRSTRRYVSTSSTSHQTGGGVLNRLLPRYISPSAMPKNRELQ